MLHAQRVLIIFSIFFFLNSVETRESDDQKLECGPVPENQEYDESEDKESESVEIRKIV